MMILAGLKVGRAEKQEVVASLQNKTNQLYGLPSVQVMGYLNKPVLQSFTVAGHRKSNLAYKFLAKTKAFKVWFSYSHNCNLANGAVFHSLC